MASSDLPTAAARPLRRGGAARAALMRLATALAVGGPGLDVVARPRRAVAVEAPPPPPPPAPAGPVDLPDRVIADAAAYDGFMRRTVAISPAFTDAAAVSSALGQARSYGPTSLVRGAIAYAAIAALQDQTFVAAVRAAGNTPEHRAQMVGYILANPAYVSLFAHSDVAAGLARRAIGPSALRLYATGKAVRQSAYDIQKQGWSKANVTDLPGRLAAAEAAASGDMNPDAERLAEARQAVAGVAPLPISAEPLAGPYRTLVAHALQLAAIGALGEAGNDAYDRLNALNVDDDTLECLATAKRNFHQCLAVARPNYEDIFCMGQHALQDTGACLAKAVGVDTPIDAPPPAAKPGRAPRRRSVSKRHGS